MFCRWAAALWGVAAVSVASAACTATPTSPSATRAAATLAVLPQLTLPVPPAIGVNVPRALGATRFVAFGDSITYGVLSSYDGRILYDGSPGSYPARLELALNTYHSPQRFAAINRGLPAEAVSAGGVQRIGSVLTTDRPQVLLLLEGINDLAGDVSVSRTASALQQVVDTSLAAGVPVIIATMYQTYPSIDPDGFYHSHGDELVPALNDRIQQIAARQNVYLADLYRAFGSNRDLLGGDGLHPTPEGYELMASTFLAAIERAFPVRGSFQ